MSQEIKIGVGADTRGADQNLNRMGQAAEGVADAVGGISAKAREAASNLERLEAIARRLANVQQILSREFGKPVHEGDATLFLSNFSKMQQGRTIGTARTRAYGSFEEWFAGHGATFRRSEDASRHRRYIMGLGMAGTSYARDGGIPGGGDAGHPYRQYRLGGNWSGRAAGIATGQNGALEGTIGDVAGGAVQMGATAAGGAIGGPVGMAIGFALAEAGKAAIQAALTAVQYAKDEAFAIDETKRKLGDIGIGFGNLKSAVEKAADGLGLTAVEAAKLAGVFSTASGGHGGIGATAGGVTAGAGLARAFGLDPSTGVGFMGAMSRLGAGDDQRKFATEIADAIVKSGYPADGDKLMAAVSNLADATAKMTGSTPAVGMYADAIGTLSGLGFAGLDPSQAGNLLGRADSAVRQGGNYGDASKYFEYSALSRGNPALAGNPWAVEALEEGGLFATSKSVFGSKAFAGIGGRYSITGDKTNFDKIMGQFSDQYQDEWMRAEAEKNFFGFSSLAQARELEGLYLNGGGTLSGKTAALLQRAGVDPSNMQMSGVLGLSRVAKASSMADLREILRSSEATGNMSRADRENLEGTLGLGNFGQSQNALARYFAEHGQEGTPASELRQSLADIQTAVTGVGERLFSPLNNIQNLIASIAGKAGIDPSVATGGGIPSFQEDKRGDTGRAGDFAGNPPPGSKGGITDLGYLNPWPGVKGVAGSNYDSMFQNAGVKWNVDPTLLKAIGMKESGLRADAVNRGTPAVPNDAEGIMQLEPAASREMGLDPSKRLDAGLNIDAGSGYFAKMLQRAGGDVRKALAMYHGGPNAVLSQADWDYADAVLREQKSLNGAGMSAGPNLPPGVRGKIGSAITASMSPGNTPVPGVYAAPQGGADTINMNFAGQIMLPVVDQHGNDTGGVATIVPTIQGKPAGGARAVQ